MIWDFKNNELKQFIQRTFSIKDDVPNTLEEGGHVWVKTRRIESLFVNIKTGEKRIIDNDLYEFEFGKPPEKIITIDGEELQWERHISGFATIADLNDVLKRARSTQYDTRFTKPPLESDGSGYGIT